MPLSSPSASPPGDSDCDLALIQRLAERDGTALGELYARHSRLLFCLIVRIVGQRGEAEEILQEAFLAAWTRADTYDPALGTPVGWLVGIARHRALDRLRSNAAHARLLDAAARDTPCVEPSAENAPAGDARRDVDRALRALPPGQRALIEQAYFLGLTHSELAERHGLPLGTVKTRIRSGMATLREQLSAATWSDERRRG
ncbi:MAG: RNA polymerase sigma factor [Vicinamibacterales bacterium]